jgi:hypothetical protein
MFIEQLSIFGRAAQNTEGKWLENYMRDYLAETPFVYELPSGKQVAINTPSDLWELSKAKTGFIFTEAASDHLTVLNFLADRIIDIISRLAETAKFAGQDPFLSRALEEGIIGTLNGMGFKKTIQGAVEGTVIPALKELSAAEMGVFQVQRAHGLATRVLPPEEPPSLKRLQKRWKANPVFMETIANRLRVKLQMPARLPTTEYLEAYRGLSDERRDEIEPDMEELAGHDRGRLKFWKQTREDIEELRRLEATTGRRNPVVAPSFRGGGKKDTSGSFCQTMITLLLLEAKQNHEFDVQEFLDKAGTTLDDLGQCPLVLHMLNQLIDISMEQQSKENSYVFSPIESDAEEFNINLEDAYYSRFTPEEQKILKSMGPPITFHSETPEAFREILGTNAYFLNGSVPEEGEDTPLYGLNQEDEEPISLTRDEREAIERKGAGVPLGALLFLYLMCLRDVKDSGEIPSLDSKCPLPTPLKPSRKSRASTPKRRKA